MKFLTHFESEVVKRTKYRSAITWVVIHDYILKIVVKDMEAYREFLVTKLTIKHIGSTQYIYD
jgi:Lrp/AsnC family leucine-responsive transcriptional regulator